MDSTGKLHLSSTEQLESTIWKSSLIRFLSLTIYRYSAIVDILA
jgi:hypothetical protein